MFTHNPWTRRTRWSPLATLPGETRARTSWRAGKDPSPVGKAAAGRGRAQDTHSRSSSRGFTSARRHCENARLMSRTGLPRRWNSPSRGGKTASMFSIPQHDTQDQAVLPGFKPPRTPFALPGKRHRGERRRPCRNVAFDLENHPAPERKLPRKTPSSSSARIQSRTTPRNLGRRRNPHRQGRGDIPRGNRAHRLAMFAWSASAA